MNLNLRIARKANHWIEQRPLASFFFLTYLISWAFWLPMIWIGDHRLLTILGSFGPTTAALLLAAEIEGRQGITALLSKLRVRGIAWGWYAFSLLSTAAVVWAAIGIFTLSGGSGLIFNDPAQWYLAVPAFLYVLLFSVAGEEPGWRGFALRRLLSRQSPLSAGLIVGILWSLWHLPLFFIPGNFHQTIPVGLFFLQSIALSILMAWMYCRTQGSLLIALLFHAASNTTLGIFPILPMDTGGSLIPLQLTVGLLCLVSIGAAFRLKSMGFTPNDRLK